jgi:hypothetical protein
LSQSELPLRDGLADGSESRSILLEKVNFEELQKRFEDGCLVIFSKEAIGDSPSTCFLKINLLLKNEFDNIRDVKLNIQDLKGKSYQLK